MLRFCPKICTSVHIMPLKINRCVWPCTECEVEKQQKELKHTTGVLLNSITTRKNLHPVLKRSGPTFVCVCEGEKEKKRDKRGKIGGKFVHFKWLTYVLVTSQPIDQMQRTIKALHIT